MSKDLLLEFALWIEDNYFMEPEEYDTIAFVRRKTLERFYSVRELLTNFLQEKSK